MTSLNSVLARLGYTTEPLTFQGKRIFRDGIEVHAGTADSTWHWLRRRGEWSEPCPVPAGAYCHHCEVGS